MPVKYSPIAPLHMLQHLHRDQLVGDYLLLLAHDVLDKPVGYASFIADLRHRHGDVTIIMDNSTIELEEPIDFQGLVEAANIVEADVVVCPDILGDFEGTKRLSDQYASKLAFEDFQVMMVPQGRAFGEITRCVKYMDGFRAETNTAWWGIPRGITNDLGSRLPVIDWINKNTIGAAGTNKIHLLGTSKRFRDDIACLAMKDVVGIDSANPLVLATRGITMTRDALHVPRRDFWVRGTPAEGLLQYNVEWMHELVAQYGK